MRVIVVGERGTPEGPLFGSWVLVKRLRIPFSEREKERASRRVFEGI